MHYTSSNVSSYHHRAHSTFELQFWALTHRCKWSKWIWNRQKWLFVNCVGGQGWDGGWGVGEREREREREREGGGGGREKYIIS